MWMCVFVDDVYPVSSTYHLVLCTGIDTGWRWLVWLLSTAFCDDIRQLYHLSTWTIVQHSEGLSVYMMSSHVGIMILPRIYSFW